jgi:molybdate transport system substrate-binding protein
MFRVMANMFGTVENMFGAAREVTGMKRGQPELAGATSRAGRALFGTGRVPKETMTGKKKCGCGRAGTLQGLNPAGTRPLCFTANTGRLLPHTTKRMRQLKKIAALSAALWLVAGLHAAQVTVFAAASLTDSLKQIAAGYEKNSGDRIIFNFAASGTLARQIEAGAPADIFISADEARADALEKKGLLAAGTRKSLLGNTLVIVTTPDAAIRSPADLTNAAIQHLALGDVKVVPAGTYAKACLEKLALWPAVESKVVPCESVRAVLAAVESGNVDAGIVYKTDAAISKKVKVAYEVPAADAPKISYPLALLKDAPQPDAAKKFIAHLDSDAATAVFKQFGFIALSSAAAK